jgi:hypothetical protein
MNAARLLGILHALGVMDAMNEETPMYHRLRKPNGGKKARTRGRRDASLRIRSNRRKAAR